MARRMTDSVEGRDSSPKLACQGHGDQTDEQVKHPDHPVVHPGKELHLGHAQRRNDC